MSDSIPSQADPTGSSGVHRLFFALWPDDATRSRIAAAAARLRLHSSGGRWIARDRYHLTLQFLGTHRRLPDALVDTVCAAAASTGAPGFAIALDRVGHFRSRPRLWWLGCERPDALLPLWEVLTQSLVARGIAVASGPFVPHVTVVRGAAGPLPAGAPLPAVVWPVTEFVLIHSESGARDAYRVLQRWPLRMQ